ncbi:MAG TPA: discoidin domain-containing protein [Candidatus Blautia merdipullorum]|nr:discoidin domain-containing protein [Candidatus Blautia merdipullorum]
MKCERCGKELSDSDLYCSRCGKAVFPEYMDEEDIWAYYKSDEELEQILKEEEGQEEESQEEVSEEEAGEPEVSETGTPLPEEAPIENSQPEILEAEPRELEAVRPEITAEDPETAFEPVIPEENPSEKEPENPGKLEQPEEQKAPEKQEYPEEISGEEEPKEGEGPEESEKESRSGEVQSLDAEDIGEEDEDLDEEDGNEEEKEPLTPEKKRARRYTALLAGIFLLLCLAAGIFLGIRRMNQLDALEKEYDQRIEESETETSSADTGNIRLLVEEPDLSQNTKLQPVSAQADSQKQSEEEDYSGSSLIDGDQATSWQEGEEGTGEGKGATLTLDGSHQIRYLVLYLGNWKSDELWSYNARPQSLAIQVGENDEEILEFPDEKQVFYLALQEPVEASEVKIRIQSSYEGERWEDNCISEIEVYE